MPEVIWIQTFTGRRVDPLNIHPEDIIIEDVAHALSNLCRFNGHCKKFYSVAEHSVYTARITEDEHDEMAALWGLLHDAHEAYMGDVSRPLKSLLPQYCGAEIRAQLVVKEAFGLPRDGMGMDRWVRRIDHAMLELECNQLMHTPDGWHLPVKPWFNFEIECWTPEKAEFEFMANFQRLYVRAHGWTQAPSSR